MTDQRKTESINRFLVRRAIQRMKHPDAPQKSIPLWHGLRWRFSAGNRSLIIRAGLFGMHLYWRAEVAVPNNVAVYAETTGMVIFLLPLDLAPGASVPCKQWVKRGIHMDQITRELF